MAIKKKTVFVFKTHLDIGYTHLSAEILDSYRGEMLESVLDILEKGGTLPFGNRYVWTFPAWLLYEIVTYPLFPYEKYLMVQKYVREGSLTWHALPYTMHTEAAGLEEFIRGLHYSKELSRMFHKEVVSAKMTDVPGHSAMLPSLLAKAGIRFLHLGCNQCCTPPDVPPLFWWEGPDGGRVLTFYSKGGYGSSSVPPEDWKYPVWLCMDMTNDNKGSRSVAAIADILEETHRLSGAECRIGTMDDFYYELIKCDLDLPVIRGDVGDTWIHGVGSYPREEKEVRSLRRELQALEKLCYLVDGVEEPYFAERVEEAYRALSLFDEHTWGLDVKITLQKQRYYSKKAFRAAKQLPCYQRIERSWDEQRERVLTARATVEELKDELLRHGDRGTSAITAYNGLTWEHSPWIRMEQDLSSVTDETGSQLPLFRGNDGTFVQIPDMPPQSACVLHPQPAAEPSVAVEADEVTLENDRYRLKASIQQGGIYSLIDKETGREWADASGGAFGRYEYEILSKEEMDNFIQSYMSEYSDWIINDLGRIRYPSVDHHTYCGTCTSLSHIGNTQLTLRYEMPAESREIYGNAACMDLTVTLLPQAGVRLDYSLVGKEETPYLEQGNFVFPFSAETPAYRINKLGHLLNPATDVVRDANHVFYAVDAFAQVRDGDNAINMVSRDIPLLSIGMPGAFRFQRTFGERSPIFYWNAFNNMWGTNFPQWNGGDYTFSFTLFADDGQHSYRQALATNSTMLLLDGTLPAMANQPIGLSPNAECISVAKEVSGWQVHLHEIDGEGGEITVTLPACPIKTVSLCNLYGEPIAELSPEGRVLQLPVKPFEVLAILIEPI